MKTLLSILLFSFLVTSIFAGSCGPQFTDELNVRALDAKNRPIPGVAISITYQLSYTKGYTTTTPFLTGEDGQMFIKIQNLENQDHLVDCNFIVTTSYGGTETQNSFTVGAHPPLIDMKMDVYYLNVNVEDQSGNPLEDALVSVDLFESNTNENGVATLRVFEGEKTIFTNYKGGERQNIVLLDDDLNYDISFFVSALTIYTIDDNGNNLESIVTFQDQTFQTTNGVAILEDIGIQSFEVKVDNEGIEKTLEVDLERELEYTVVFDFTSPLIKSVTDDHTEKLTELSIVLEDPGIHSSGINPSSLSVQYDAGDGWKNAKVYLKGGNLYNAELESIPTDSVVFFEIYVEDNDGNSVSLPGNFLVFHAIDGENGDTNGNGTQPSDDFDLMGLLMPILGVIVLLVVIYFAYIKFLKKGEESPPLQ